MRIFQLTGISNAIVRVALCAFCTSAIFALSGCVTPSNSNLADTYSYVNGKPLQRTWINKVSNNSFELTGIIADYYSFDFNYYDRGCTLAVPTTFERASLTYLVPIVFDNKTNFDEFYKQTKGTVVKIQATREPSCFKVISWKQLDSRRYSGKLPNVELNNTFPWGGFIEKFPNAKTSKGEIILEPFWSMTNEEKMGGRYVYTITASTKAYGSPVLACIEVESIEKLDIYPENYYCYFENIKIVQDEDNRNANKFIYDPN